MGVLRRVYAALMLLMLSAAILALPAAATTTTSKYDGLEVTIEMDKEVYNTGEPITAKITVKNTSMDTITITNLEQLIPEGYKLAPNSKAAEKDIDLPPSRQITLEVTYEGEPEAEGQAEQTDIFSKLLYGETMGIPNLLIVVILAIAFAIFMFLT